MRSASSIRSDIGRIEAVLDAARATGTRHPQHGELVGVLYRLRGELMWATDPTCAEVLYPELAPA